VYIGIDICIDIYIYRGIAMERRMFVHRHCCMYRETEAYIEALVYR